MTVTTMPWPHDLAAMDAGEPGPLNPVAVTGAFLYALTYADQPDLGLLRKVVTNSSLPDWGDFVAARQLVARLGLATRYEQRTVRYQGHDLRIAYVKLPVDPGSASTVALEHVALAVLLCTLVRVDDDPQWLVHALGGYWGPTLSPRQPD